MSAEATPGSEVRGLAKKGVAQVLIRSLAMRGIGLVGVLTLATQLPPADFGLVAFGLTFQVVGRFLSDSGIGAGLLRQTTPPSRHQLQSLLGFQLVVVGTCCLLLAVIVAPLGTGGLIATIMVSSLLIEAFLTPGTLICQHRLEYGPVVASELASTVVFWIVSIAGVAAGFGVWAVAAAAPLGSMAGTLIMITRSRVCVLRPRFSIDAIRDLWRFGASFQLGQAVLVGRDQGVNLLVAAVGGTVMLGLWNLAYRLLQTTSLMFRSVLRVTFPAMARLFEIGADTGPIVQRMLSRMTLATGAVLGPLVAASPALVPAAFGSEWEPTVDILAPAALGVLFLGPLGTSIVGYLYAKGHAIEVARGTALGAAVSLAIIAALVPRVGSTAVGVAMLVGALVEAVYLIRMMRRLAPLPLVHNYLVPIGCTVLATLPVVLVREMDHTIGIGVAAGLATAALQFALLMLFARPQVTDLWRMGAKMVRSRSELAAG